MFSTFASSSKGVTWEVVFNGCLVKVAVVSEEGVVVYESRPHRKSNVLMADRSTAVIFFKGVSPVSTGTLK